MLIWSEQKTIFNRDKTTRVDIRQSPNGRLFRYYVSKWFETCDEDEGALDDGYWSISDMSGYYEEIEECEAGARSDVPELCDME